MKHLHTSFLWQGQRWIRRGIVTHTLRAFALGATPSEQVRQALRSKQPRPQTLAPLILMFDQSRYSGSLSLPF